jgi:sugar/nucleoside kinase (ribokinase family)
MAEVVVAGHLCLDILPAMQHLPPSALASPGKLFEVGPLTFATGGAVSNVGLALHRLGIDVSLMAALGDDLTAELIRAILRRHGVSDADIRTETGHSSSYSVVLAAQGQDRIFLHYTGNNATFAEPHVNMAAVAQAQVFHLGYPPLLPALTVDDGAPLAALYQAVRTQGTVTSLDMAHPDPSGASGRVDWRAVLKRTLPFVDVFVPSIEELLFMLRRDDYERWQGHALTHVTLPYLHDLAEELLQMGAGIVGFKLGEAGMYLRATADPKRLTGMRLALDAASWAGFVGYQPAFAVEVVGTTGAGDCAYAGLLAGLLRGLPPMDCLRLAAAVGACSVEAADAVSGVRTYEATRQRLDAPWRTLPSLEGRPKAQPSDG